MELDERLLNACLDYKYLLARGYNREGALRFVGNRYLLSKVERLLLYRAVFSPEEVAERRKKLIQASVLRGKTALIDGFNVLTTIEAALRGDKIFLCEDGFVRDLTSIYRKIKINPLTFRALEEALEALRELKVGRVLMIFDAQVSRSGDLSSSVNELLNEKGIRGEAFTSKSADSEIVRLEGVIMSSDSYIISRAKELFDLAGHIIRERFKDCKLIDVAKAIREGSRRCLGDFLRESLEG